MNISFQISPLVSQKIMMYLNERVGKKRAKTNIKIGDKNSLHYFREFGDVDNFDNILKSHLIPKEFIERGKFKPEDYKDFLYARAELFCQKLKDELPDVEVEIIE